MKSLRVQVLASRHGGVLFGPFVPDTRGTGRFPPAVRIKASLLGVQLGELTLENAERFGRVLDLSVGWPWLSRPVAGCLVREAEALGPQAAWSHLAWQVPASDASARSLARSLGFRPVSAAEDEDLFQRPIDGLRL